MARLVSTLVVLALLIRLTAAGLVTQQPPQSGRQAPLPPAKPSAISGVVTDGTTGKPIAGAAVSLSDPQAKISAGMVTDSKGRFVFTDLPASQGYSFNVAKSGYYNMGRGRLFVEGVETTIPLAENEWRQHEDVVLWPFGAISGTVFDEQGERVVGVPVKVLTQVAVGGNLRWLAGAMATTDDRGMYRVDELRRGTYVVQVPNVQSTVPPTTTSAAIAGMTPAEVARGVAVPPSLGLNLGGTWLTLGQYAVPPPLDGRYRAYPTTYYPGSQTFAGAAFVRLEDGEQKVGIDVALNPVSTASVSGRVVGPSEARAGLVMRLLAADSPIDSKNSEAGTALVAPDGTFTIVGVPVGQYILSSASTDEGNLSLGGEGFLPTPGLMRPTSFSVRLSGDRLRVGTPHNGIPYSGRTSVTVGTQDVSGVVVELRGSANFSGRLVSDTGAPLRESIFVAANGTGDPTLVRPHAIVPPDPAAQGRFVLTALPESDYLLNAFGNRSVVKSITGPGGDFTDRPLHATAGSDITDMVITLTEQSAGLKGGVRDRNGATVTECAVILFPADRSKWSHFGLDSDRIKYAVVTGREGYTLSRLRAGSYLIVATALENTYAWHDSRFLEAAAAVATPVTLTWGESGVVNLTLRQVTAR